MIVEIDLDFGNIIMKMVVYFRKERMERTKYKMEFGNFMIPLEK